MRAQKSVITILATVHENGDMSVALPNGRTLKFTDDQRRSVLNALDVIESIIAPPTSMRRFLRSILNFKPDTKRTDEMILEINVITYNDGDMSVAVPDGKEVQLTADQVQGALGLLGFIEGIFNPASAGELLRKALGSSALMADYREEPSNTKKTYWAKVYPDLDDLILKFKPSDLKKKNSSSDSNTLRSGPSDYWEIEHP